MPFPFTPYTDS